MVSFAIFYEKFRNHENWESYNKTIPYINENAIQEAILIIEYLNKADEESKAAAAVNDVTQKMIENERL